MSSTQIMLPEPVSQTVNPVAAPGSRRRRLVEICAVVVLAVTWVGFGSVLGAGPSDLLPLVVAAVLLIHLVVRRRPLHTAFNRDIDSFAARWPGRSLVAATLVAVPAAMLFASVAQGTYADDSWTGLSILVVLAVAYLASRRLLLTLLVAGVVVSVTSWVLAPNLAGTRNGDATVLAHLDRQAGIGMLEGYHDIAVAEVDLGASQPVRLAGIGASDTTAMEVGSLTKAMTGLVIADAVRRGEIRMNAPVSTYLPALKGSPAGAITMHELVTHTAGYVEFGATTLRSAAWKAPLGQNFLAGDSAQMTREARNQTLTRRGSYSYSTLGAATAGQAVAAAAHMNYPNLMRTRLFAPLGMTHTAIQHDHSLVASGQSQTGLPVRPWVMSAYAPGGAAVSTTGDLAKLAAALLDGTAPGMTALDPTTATGQSNTRVGTFWQTSAWQNGQTITWHDGQTGGYASYFGLDRANHKAVIVLTDVANVATTDLGIELLINRQ